MPRNDHRKNSPNIRYAAKLMSGPSEVSLPIGTEQALQAHRGAHHHGDHEDAEAGVDDVHRQAQDHGLAPPEEGQIFEDHRQGGQEDDSKRRRQHHRQGTSLPRRELLVQHVEYDVLPLGQQHIRCEEHDPDIADGADLQRPGYRRIEDVPADDLDHECAEHEGERCRRDQFGAALELGAKVRHRHDVLERQARCIPQAPAALMRSSMPAGQSLEKSELTNLSSTWARNAATYGVVTFSHLHNMNTTDSITVATTSTSNNTLPSHSDTCAN